jgi:hypothetical protein
MDGWWLRQLQDIEYENSLRDDIETEIISEARKLDREVIFSLEIEKRLISEADYLDEEESSCKLSPRSLRLKRLQFFEPVLELKMVFSVKNTHRAQCIGITKLGVMCKKNVINGRCHIYSSG